MSVASCARCQSRFAQSPRRVESRVIASSVVSRRQSPRREESRVIASSVVSLCVVQLLGVSRVVVRRPAAGVSRVVRSACESRPFFLSFQTRWMTFFFVLY